MTNEPDKGDASYTFTSLLPGGGTKPGLLVGAGLSFFQSFRAEIVQRMSRSLTLISDRRL